MEHSTVMNRENLCVNLPHFSSFRDPSFPKSCIRPCSLPGSGACALTVWAQVMISSIRSSSGLTLVILPPSVGPPEDGERGGGNTSGRFPVLQVSSSVARQGPSVCVVPLSLCPKPCQLLCLEPYGP